MPTQGLVQHLCTKIIKSDHVSSTLSSNIVHATCFYTICAAMICLGFKTVYSYTLQMEFQENCKWYRPMTYLLICSYVHDKHRMIFGDNKNIYWSISKILFGMPPNIGIQYIFSTVPKARPRERGRAAKTSRYVVFARLNWIT